MTPLTFHLQFITPCFCSGATLAVAEIRAPSIRGKLRWWFRVLGGTKDQEAEVFGATAGESGSSSAVIIRVADTLIKHSWQPIKMNSLSNTGYLLYFAKSSGDGARWVAGGAIPELASFDLQLYWRRKVSLAAKDLFDLALDSFLSLGSLGLRSTRGLGCFEAKEKPFEEEKFQALLKRIQERAPTFNAWLAEFRQTELLDAMGAQLRSLRSGCSAGRPGHANPSPLGSSNKPRQTSAVYLRPVKECNERYRLVVFEAPADKVLGPESRNGSPLLRNGIPALVQPRQHKY